ncbi:DNA-binding transcriptional regulator, LysR family [Sporobacter termitidis DSM 10068]|uniref:DNA-binding transcriptional regulator, LysR family n=1 Tax=Sporobacter termitidis DSM 10068 TaxID=1123282 RepID=A0A1M5XCD1_9FIRM|nr:LysR family transcriptional regulator [Sporobacter termitidis]SHH97312.1 DNA-binding transcriptional regulator, LysR family [Sporobacter termitidis DSM 10068]
MDIAQLRCFISIAQTLNFTEAAKQNGMTQPGISHHINELEKQLEARLFIRTNRNVELTNSGKEFLPYALDIVQTAEKAAFRVKQAESGALGHVSVSAVSTSSAIVSRCLAEFYKKHPKIFVDISFTSGNAQILAINENKYDFHFVLLDYIPAGKTFDYIVTHEDQLCLILPKGHPMAGQPLDFSKLKDEPFITFDEAEGPALYAQIMNICKYYNYTPQIVNRYDRAESVLLSVGAGLGISIIPKAISSVFYSDDVAFVPITGVDTHRTYVIAWHNNLHNPSAQLFLEVVKELFHKEPSQSPHKA